MSTNRYEAALLTRVQSVQQSVWYAMLAALLLGVLAHIAALTGLIVNGDNTVPVVSGKWLLTQGKWANGYLADLRGLVNMNIVTGLIGLLWISAAAGLTVSALRMRSRLSGALTGAMMALFPSVMCTFLYNAPDIFFFALLLAALSVWLSVRYKWGCALAVPILAVSIGTYQAYIGFAAALFVLVALSRLMQGDMPLKRILLDGFMHVGVLLLSVALYYGILLLFVQSPENLQSYRNINQMGSFSLASILHYTREAYRQTLKFLLLDNRGVIGGHGALLYRLSLATCAALFLLQAFRSGLFRKPARLLVTLALVSAFPLAVNAIVVLAQNVDTHWLMIYAFVLLFIAMLLLSDLCAQPASADPAHLPDTENTSGWRDAAAFGARALPAVLSLALLAGWYLITTQNYARMRLAYEGAYGTCAVVAANVVSEDAFTGETPVAVIGYIEDDSTDFAFLDNFTGSFDRDYLFNSWIVQRMIVRFVQVPMTFVPPEEKERILASAYFAAMPAYPDKGYIAEHDGILVVKLSEDEPVIFG